MQKAVNALRGSVRVEVEGPFPERFINLCAASEVEFWDLRRVSETVMHVSVRIKGYKKMRPVAEKALCKIKPIGRRGLPFLAWRLRKRYVLIAGFLLVWAALWLMSLFIWEIHVSGNEKVSDEVILAALEDIGIGIGTFGPSISPEELRSEILCRVHELSWITVNVSGSSAEVIVRERTPKPEMLDESKPTNVVAVKAGIITEMYVYEGVSRFNPGDTVVEGDILVSGEIVSKLSETRYVHAMADIYARTWYEISAQIPSEYKEKRYTGDESVKRALIFFGKRINLYFTSGILMHNCDKIAKETKIQLPGGMILPFGIVTETYREYETYVSEISETEAREILGAALYEQLLSQINGEIISAEYETQSVDGIITVTLKAECHEQIAAVSEIIP